MFDFPEIVESVQFDLQRSGTVLLGKDTAATLNNNETANTIQTIIENETNNRKLAIDMMKKNRMNENEFAEKLQMINDFKTGLNLR